ncbi:MAG: transglycosylase domain-containing protein [Bdellovibrionales bacterium]|nr:transglycosylase domain-containing protein [Bdellovibrionales bacterium]
MSIKKIIAALLGLLFIGIGAGSILVLSLSADLPKMIKVEDYEPLLVSEVYDREGGKIGEFFREKRMLLAYEDIPQAIIQAFTSAEDATFFKHGGINYTSTLRALLANIRAGRKVQGGSTITMQVARSILLTPEKTYTRKIKEVMLSYRMESNLTKQEILYLYLNQIYLGQGSYGIGAAADIYFRKSVKDLTLPEIALLAGLPQAPSRYSPISNPSSAKERQRYVLSRMAEEGYITSAEATQAAAAPVQVYVRKDYKELAPYYLETVRQLLVKKLGEETVLDRGIKVFTGLDIKKQIAAQDQVRLGLRQLDKRQGYRGPKGNLTGTDKVAEFLLKSRNDLMDEASAIRTLKSDGSVEDKGKLNLTGLDKAGKPLPNLPSYISLNQIVPAIVVKIDDKWGLVHVRFAESRGMIDFQSMKWARRPDPGIRAEGAEILKASDALKVGDLIDVKVIDPKFRSDRISELLTSMKKKAGKNYSAPSDLPEWSNFCLIELEQDPTAEGALVSIDQNNNDLISLVGGKDFTHSEFNRALQAARQTGSAFKTLVYASALDKGFTPATSLIDSPIVYEDDDAEVQDMDTDAILKKKWKPLNHSKKFSGETLFRGALIQSLNVPTVKIIEKISVEWVAAYAHRLGIFSPLNYDFTMALGSSGITLYEMTKAFATFGRLGRRVSPILIHRVEDKKGNILLEKIGLDERFESELGPQESEFEQRRVAYLRYQSEVNPKDQDSNNNNTNENNENSKQTEKKIPASNLGKTGSNQNEAPSYLLKIEDTGKTIDLRKEPPFYFDDPDQLLRPETSYVMTTLLQAVVEEPGGTGRAARALGRPAAAKTGSTSGYYDAWFMGYTPDIATGVWVGFDEERSLGKGEVGGRAALPIWTEYMKIAHEGIPIRNFPIPDGIVFANIDNTTGKLASNATQSENVIRQAFIEGTEPSESAAKNNSQEEKDFIKEDLSQ